MKQAEPHIVSEKHNILLGSSAIVVATLFFAAVAVLHLLRIILGWSAVINGFTIPIWASWIGAVVAALMALWLFTSKK